MKTSYLRSKVKWVSNKLRELPLEISLIMSVLKMNMLRMR